MQYKILGHSNMLISRIGFGCMSLHPGQDGIQTLIDAAIDGGINYFDTADLYDGGANETMIGAALKAKRDKVFIATKAGNQLREDGSGWDWNPRKEYILQAVENSLRRLQTDYIDLYQLHGGTIDDPMDETIEAFEWLKKAGMIRHYGISSIRPNVIREYVKRSSITSVMMQYSLLDRRAEESCFDLLLHNNIGVVARGTVAGGLLAGKAAKPYLGHEMGAVQAAADMIREIAMESSQPPATTAIQFVLQHPAVTGAIVGIRTKEQLDDALRAGYSNLSEEHYHRLQASVAAGLYTDHR
ncbi:aldo/keto reductase [Flavihumibacter stibioxidans]|uniref:Oxidoreductase n=1 Tax=Flavihumibacter stibioxidans TaxID=1834163 RepID=A0ABR7M9X4_9BACT|nr:aldo/keto reductase [Flavihumibacter stibioxidans]MBC6491421.1 oxidoreductase [Flavihumibacter stibioxidans]